MVTLTYGPQEFAGQLSSYAAGDAEYRLHIERVPDRVKRYWLRGMVHTTLQSASVTRWLDFLNVGYRTDYCNEVI